jgi:Stealth protein CR2, conserved region 2/Stealth protein CR3, conserved region 3/Stealth protein CR1, conserved region 1/Stealth protein CR4, conserved region 4
MSIRSFGIAALKRAGLVESMLALRDQMATALVPVQRMIAERVYGRLLATHPDLLLVHHDGRWELGRRTDRLVVHDVMSDNLAMATQVLQQHAITCFVVPIPTPNRYRLGIPATQRAAAFDALLQIADPAVYVYVDDVELAPRHRRVRLRPSLSRRVRSRLQRRPVWRFYVNRADAEARTVLGHLHGCEIEFWPESEQGRKGSRPLVAERWNKKAAELPADVTATDTVEISGRSYPTIPEFLGPRLAEAPARAAARYFDDVTFPIDVVYTWVDGDDPLWLERKNAVLRKFNLATVHPDAHDASRYRSRDELKYSLRSVATYADFVRHIFVVTDDQTPDWLNTDHPRVTVVPHKEIFDDAGSLPTFNSHAIESRLHHIDGLAEHYLYLNDDFLFCRRVAPETFFLSNGLSHFFPSTALIGLYETPRVVRSVDAAARNSRALIHRHFGSITHQKMKHAPYPQRRSVLFEAEETFADEFARTASNQIRSPTDIPVASAFSHYYGYLTGRAVPGTIAARYVELSAEDFDRRLRDLERRRNADTVCINDAALESTPDVAGRERRLQDFLDMYWPLKSEFEW